MTFFICPVFSIDYIVPTFDIQVPAWCSGRALAFRSKGPWFICLVENYGCSNFQNFKIQEVMQAYMLRGGLRAYAMTISLLGFECTCYEIKSRDTNEKGTFFFITNHICLQQVFMVHCTWPWCVHSVPAPTLTPGLHAHTQGHCLLLLG